MITRYRQLEEGMHAREAILEALTESRSVFIYERDVRKLTKSLAAFDAFICAYTALLADHDLCAEKPKGFPETSGWVEFPSLDGDEFPGQCPDPSDEEHDDEFKNTCGYSS